MRREWFFLLMMTWAGSAAAEQLSIDQAVREALGNNPLIQQEAANRQAAHYGEKEARSAFFPRLTTAYSYRNLTDAPFVEHQREPGHNQTAVTSTTGKSA